MKKKFSVQLRSIKYQIDGKTLEEAILALEALKQEYSNYFDIKIDVGLNWEYGDYYPDITLSGYREETDEEYAKRLKKEELDKENARKSKEKQAVEKEKKDWENYLRLKAKFEP